jgi:hypothetical protein
MNRHGAADAKIGGDFFSTEFSSGRGVCGVLALFLCLPAGHRGHSYAPDIYVYACA